MKKGVTLIEMLVAGTIMSFILSGLAGTYILFAKLSQETAGMVRSQAESNRISSQIINQIRNNKEVRATVDMSGGKISKQKISILNRKSVVVAYYETDFIAKTFKYGTDAAHANPWKFISGTDEKDSVIVKFTSDVSSGVIDSVFNLNYANFQITYIKVDKQKKVNKIIVKNRQVMCRNS